MTNFEDDEVKLPMCERCKFRAARSFTPDGSMTCIPCRLTEELLLRTQYPQILIASLGTEAGDPEEWRADTWHFSPPGDGLPWVSAIVPERVDSDGQTDESILQEAERIINGQRAEDYGDASESFNRTAGMWSAYVGADLSALDVANLMILLKVSRTRNGFHRDSHVDICGYAGLSDQLRPSEEASA